MRDLDNYRKWKRDWYAKNADKERARKLLAYRTNPEVKKRVFEAVANHKKNNPLKWRCRKLFAQAIRRGTIIRKSCKECGVSPAEGHHEDYNEPYKVIWLCKRCHMFSHRGARIKS